MSAFPQRTGVHVRSMSANPNNRLMRENLTSLKQEVMQSKAESQKLRDELNCLIFLVKRAWSGDTAAAINVAKIVGVAPPEIHVTPNDYNVEANSVEMVTRPRAVSNWATLTVKLLNKQYRSVEEEIKNLQQKRLKQREQLLDEQLNNHDSAMYNGLVAAHQDMERQASLPKSSMTPDPHPHREVAGEHVWFHGDSYTGDRPMKLGNISTEIDQLFLKVAGSSVGQGASSMSQQDARTHKPPTPTLQRRPVQHPFRPTSGRSQLLGHSSRVEPVQPKEMTSLVIDLQPAMHEASSTELFKTDDVAQFRPKRPVSAVVQRRNDNSRARPKTAQAKSITQDRPMKSETTFPQAKSAAKSTRPPRPQTAKATPISQGWTANFNLTHGVSPYPTYYTDMTDEYMEMRQREEEIRRQTSHLQNKLGLPTHGQV